METNVLAAINFSIVRVTTEQFAIIEEAFKESSPINLNTTLRFALDKENRVVAVFVLFKFEQNEIPFIKLDVSCHFAIELESWSTFVANETVVIPKGFMTHLGMITVGTARGVLHTKTEGTRFNNFVLPTINVNELVTNDVTFA